MRKMLARHRLKFIILGAIFLLALTLISATLSASYGTRPTLQLDVSTDLLPSLIPHAHGPADKISDIHHGIIVTSLPVVVPDDMWVTDIRVTTNNAPQTIIHHMDVDRLNDDGTINRIRRPIFTYGQDTPNTIRFPAPTGIFLAQGQKIGIEAILHNPVPPLGEGGIYRDVTVTVEFRGIPDKKDRYLPIYFHLLRVTDSILPNDDDSMFTVPPHTEHQQFRSEDNPESATGSAHVFDESGWIIHMGAHMHAWEGGEEVNAYLNGKLIKAYSSRLTNPLIPWSWQTEGGLVLIPVKKGDVFTVATTYSNPGDEPVQGAMGMVGILYTRDLFSLALPWYAIRFEFEHMLYAVLEALDLNGR